MVLKHHHFGSLKPYLKGGWIHSIELGLLSFLGKRTQDFLWVNYTWDSQKSGFDFDYPSQKTIKMYKDMQKLIEFIMGKNDKLQIGSYLIEKDHYRRGSVIVDQKA